MAIGHASFQPQRSGGGDHPLKLITLTPHASKQDITVERVIVPQGVVSVSARWAQRTPKVKRGRLIHPKVQKVLLRPIDLRHTHKRILSKKDEGRKDREANPRRLGIVEAKPILLLRGKCRIASGGWAQRVVLGEKAYGVDNVAAERVTILLSRRILHNPE